MPYPQIDPIIFSLGPLAVHWYGVAYVASILLGWLYARSLLANDALWPANRPPMTRAQIDDFIFWAAIGIVLGGRIGYILFYDLAPVLAHPLRAVEIWNGGMSFHGGLIGVTLAIAIFARTRSINVWQLCDVIAPCVPIGLFFGRLANFVNDELWGRITDVPWAMIFPTGGPYPRHPSQLYEAGLEGIVLFLVLRFLTHRIGTLKRPRLTAGAFVAGYALCRIFVEFFREPDPQLGYLAGGWLTMGMVLSLPMLAVGIWAMAWTPARPAAGERLRS
ncbi:prolipoprotein diacylglyceryl transferase [Pararhizobium mangrovi]|uniref:Phosphatidylglycerol--prolipoprotein diacylglyceryl transferase n=1 Tax=Pararhizobium mangrovi TaxID=2590452 RepID=A0A506UCS5_9HYPH|nr:prolipoprotein diacylglyceryl transferase [Pararhizobium mangrovi]